MYPISCYQLRISRRGIIVDLDILPILNQIESLLRLHLNESRFFSLSDLLESLKRIRGDDPSSPYTEEMIDLVVEMVPFRFESSSVWHFDFEERNDGQKLLIQRAKNLGTSIVRDDVE